MFNDHRKIALSQHRGTERPQKSPVPQETAEAVRLHRLARIREQLSLQRLRRDSLYHPVNIRYATALSNKQVWMLHNAPRYVFVFADGRASCSSTRARSISQRASRRSMKSAPRRHMVLLRDQKPH